LSDAVLGVVICVEQYEDCLHMVHLMPLHPKTPSSVASFKSRLVLPFWYRLTRVVLEKKPTGVVVVVVVVAVSRDKRRKSNLTTTINSVLQSYIHGTFSDPSHLENDHPARLKSVVVAFSQQHIGVSTETHALRRVSYTQHDRQCC